MTMAGVIYMVFNNLKLNLIRQQVILVMTDSIFKVLIESDWKAKCKQEDLEYLENERKMSKTNARV